MATLGVRWRETEEFAWREVQCIMYNYPLKLPDNEFEFFKRMLLRRLGIMVRVFTHKPMINNPMVKFLWVVFHRLDREQRREIEADDIHGVIQAWRDNMASHPAELEELDAYRAWGQYWSTKNYLLHVHGITSMDGVELIDDVTTRKLITKAQNDPRRAYCNNLAIQWTGDNKGDIERYYGKHFDFYTSGDDLVISTGVGPLTVKLGHWTWPDSSDGIDGGDYTYLIQRKLEIGIGLWIKPGSNPIASN